jgi:hypothetical protein
MNRLTLTIVLASVLAAATCGSGADFTGTWERPLGEGFSSLSFEAVDGGYRVRWNKVDGITTVRCDDHGSCEELVGDEKVCDWRFEVRPGADDRQLILVVEGVPVDGALAPVSYVDRLVLEPGGRAISSHPVATEGSEAESNRPVLRFSKVSDRPL